MTTDPPWPEPDWAALRDQLGAIEADLRNTHPDAPWTTITAQALRQLVLTGRDLMIAAEAQYTFDTARLVEQANYDRHTAELQALRESHTADEKQVRMRLAAALREAADNPRRVPSRYRAEGVRMAADWINP